MRHLRYEIYEKKQIQPLLNQRRRSRSNRSESEHSLTASANPRSPDTAAGLETVGIGSENVSESVFGCAGSDEAPPDAVATAYHLPEQTHLPTLDVRLCRISTSTLVALTRTTSLSTESDHADTRTPMVDVCQDSSWPERSFPLVDADCDKLLATKSSNDSCCRPSSATSASLTMSVGSSVTLAGPDVTDNTQWSSVTTQSSVHSIPNVTPVTTLH